MAITVSGRHINVSDELRAYAEEKIGAALKVVDSDSMNTEITLRVERNRAIACPCICEVTVIAKGHIIRVEESEEELHAAIDVAAAKVVRQLRKYKTRVMDRRMEASAIRAEASDPDFDALMAELSADDEIVRVKEIDFEPLTEEEALIKIDLLGHDFFAYTDRDSNAVCVLYRRSNGGYGILKQAL